MSEDKGCHIDSEYESGPHSLPEGPGVRPRGARQVGTLCWVRPRGARQVGTLCCGVDRCCVPSGVVSHQAFVNIKWQEVAVHMSTSQADGSRRAPDQLCDGGRVMCPLNAEDRWMVALRARRKTQKLTHLASLET